MRFKAADPAPRAVPFHYTCPIRRRNTTLPTSREARRKLGSRIAMVVPERAEPACVYETNSSNSVG